MSQQGRDSREQRMYFLQAREECGDFAADASLSVTEQIDSQISLLSEKRPIQKYIAYFQAYTNTYGPVNYLREIYEEALSHPGIVAMSIGDAAGLPRTGRTGTSGRDECH